MTERVQTAGQSLSRARLIGRGLPCIAVLVLAACDRDDSARVDESPAYASASYASVDTTAVTSDLIFTDITREAGITFVHETGAFGEKWMPETMGSGGGFLDYDMDGLPDLFLVNSSEWPGHERPGPRPTPHLYRNLGGGKFEDVTARSGAGINLYGMGAAFGDYDADGDPDIYITAVGDNVLLRNDDGVFADVTATMDVTGNSDDPSSPPAWSTAAVWVDVDRDGWIDLFVCNYVQWTPATDLFTTLDGKSKSYATPQQYRGESCRLYRNHRGRSFEDVTEESGVFNPNGKSLGVAVTDFNGDSWPDLVVANDTERNFLYLNQGDGTFSDIAMRAGIGFDEFGRARAGMGIDVADINGDGNLSIVIGNFSREPLSLYTQIGTQLFQDFAGSARLTRETLLKLTFGVVFVDLDLDGYVDLVTGNGHIEPEINGVQQDITFAQRPQVFVNTRDSRFVNTSDLAGPAFQLPIVARGIAYADIDRDGDNDLLFTVNGGSPRLLRNDVAVSEKNWIALSLKGAAPNTGAIGAVATVYAGTTSQKLMVRTGSSYLSQSDLGTLLFGLGESPQADSIVIRWPTSGRILSLGPATAGQRYSITEGDGRLVQASSLRQ